MSVMSVQVICDEKVSYSKADSVRCLISLQRFGSKQMQEGVTDAWARLKQAAESRKGDEPESESP
jgi:hypothetical protein